MLWRGLEGTDFTLFLKSNLQYFSNFKNFLAEYLTMIEVIVDCLFDLG